MSDDQLQATWRKFVNSLPELEDGGMEPPPLERIHDDTPKNYTEDAVLVYKLSTEIYVYQHIGADTWFGSTTLQDVTILGEMTLDQARSLVNAKKLRRKKQ